MNMKRSLSCFAAMASIAAVACLLPQIASAAEKSTAKPVIPATIAPKWFRGKIEAIDVKADTITVKHEDKDKVFHLAKDCRYDGFATKVASLTDLKVGEHVRVSYTEENGKLIGHIVDNVRPESAANPTSKKNSTY